MARPPTWTTVWALGVATIVAYGTTQYLFGVLVLPIGAELGWSRGLLGGAFSTCLVVSGIAGIPIGRWVDAHGARGLMTAGAALGGLSLAAAAEVREPWQLYLAWGVGVALANAMTFYPITFTVVTGWFSEARPRALALLTTLGGLASVIFVPLAGALVPVLGWRSTVLVMAACFALIVAPLGWLLVPGGPAPSRIPGGSGSTARQALRGGSFWMLASASALTLMAHGVLLAHLVPYLVGTGEGPVLAATAAGLLGLASLPARVVMNLLAGVAGARALLVASTGLQAAGIAILVAAAAAPGLAWAFVAVYGFAFGAISPLRAAVYADHFGQRSYGAITALAGAPAAVAGAAGPLAAGVLFDRLGSYTVALALTATAFCISALLVAFTPRPRAGRASPPAPTPAAA